MNSTVKPFSSVESFKSVKQIQYHFLAIYLFDTVTEEGTTVFAATTYFRFLLK